MAPHGIVIVGAGHAGASTAALLRQKGYTGPVSLIGAEAHFPYQRPPVSKEYLIGSSAPLDLLRAEDFYTSHDIDLRRNVRVTGIDASRRRLDTSDGEQIAYDTVVLATGARPRQLPLAGAELKGVLSLRNYEDAGALRELMAPAHHLAIIGGGYVGLEAASAAEALGCRVTLFERDPRLLARVASTELSSWLAEKHREHGATIITNADVTKLLSDEAGHVRAVQAGDGTEISCDAVLVGVGAVPRDELAVAAGAQCSGGIVVDERTRTSVEGILAVGDVTRRPVHRYPGSYRLESIPSAQDQAKQCVAEILGEPTPPPAVPWFWSDQLGVKVQIAGLIGTAESSIVRGDLAAGTFAVYHFSQEARVMAVEAVNSPGDFMAGKRWIDSGERIDIDQFSDPTVSLRELMAASASSV